MPLTASMLAWAPRAGAVRFRWVKALTSAELSELAQRIAKRIGRFLERQGPLPRDAQKSYLAGGVMDEGPMDPSWGHSITYLIAVGPQAGRKVLTLQTLPVGDPEEALADATGKAAGFRTLSCRWRNFASGRRKAVPSPSTFCRSCHSSMPVLKRAALRLQRIRYKRVVRRWCSSSSRRVPAPQVRRARCSKSSHPIRRAAILPWCGSLERGRGA
jgi:hypothetical protein